MNTKLITPSYGRASTKGGMSLARRIRDRPGPAIRYVIALLRGYGLVALCRVRGVHFITGQRLRIFGHLSIRGPGRVILGTDIVIEGTVNLWTYAPESRILIGDNVKMDGTRVSCVQEIKVGQDCIISDARIMDSDFHSTRADRRSATAPVRVAPVRIDDNVWIAASTMLLPGTSIGRNSVVGAGAVCMSSFPADKIIVGNPARVAMPIPSTESQ